MSCNNSGTSPKDGQAAKSDGTVIDLATITKNIKDTVAFAKSVKEVHTLVKSIDELAKAIGKNFKDDGTLENEQNHNGALVTGVYQLISDVKGKLTKLETGASKFAGLKEKVVAAKTSSGTFLDKLKGESDLRKEGITDAHAKSAILVTDGTKDKGAKELSELNTAIDELLKAAEAAVESAIKELITPAKSESTKPSNT
ncbi:Vsp/OspC family lipoprotein [Borrelia turicatae]|uniref:Vsp/OspC family lipoprotein n=1 Tax=Borrelia turicatae TaxID=142 RepID=UPI001FF5939F|nr:Vsp/OspC family lipoprotein [Borrelia turicatae]